jgi:hypothetical protein
LAVVLISGCSDRIEESEPFQAPNLSGRPEATQLIKESWPKLMAHCPGLSKFQTDLSFQGIDDMLDPFMEEMSRVEVKFKIAEEPTAIPNSFRAWGHTCGYGISPLGAILRIQKDMCVSVCLATEYNGPTDYVAIL